MLCRRWAVGTHSPTNARGQRSFDEERAPLQTVKSPQKGNQITASQMDGCHWGVPNAPCKVGCVAFVFRDQELVSLPALFE